MNDDPDLPEPYLPDLAAPRDVLRKEAAALAVLAEGPLHGLAEALALLYTTTMRPAFIATTGLGKSSFAARRLAASLCAIGAPALYLHPTDALHGDMGALALAHALIVISRSGKSAETNLLALQALPTPVIAITEGGTLESLASIVVRLPAFGEARTDLPLPNVSAAMEGALCDALVLGLAELLPDPVKFFRTVHPGGSLGKELRN